VTVGTPKWFAATSAVLTNYVQQRITRQDAFKPIEASPDASPHEATNLGVRHDGCDARLNLLTD
jgi:hypothetical protein